LDGIRLAIIAVKPTHLTLLSDKMLLNRVEFLLNKSPFEHRFASCVEKSFFAQVVRGRFTSRVEKSFFAQVVRDRFLTCVEKLFVAQVAEGRFLAFLNSLENCVLSDYSPMQCPSSVSLSKHTFATVTD
jgi:hypothetical protein